MVSFFYLYVANLKTKLQVFGDEMFTKKYVFPKILEDIATNFSSNFEEE